jgi:capsular polysaccharide biosynthesis protein
MELKSFLNEIWSKKLLVLVVCAMCLGAGAISYFILPRQFEASGSFFIHKKLEDIPGRKTYFDYDGYYAQQTAVNFAATFYSLIESPDILAQTLVNMKISPVESTIRKLEKNIKIKKASPQLITVYFYSYSQENAEKTWNTLANAAIEKSTQLNKAGDNSIIVSNVTEKPLVKETFRNIWLNTVIGALLGALASITYIGFSIYLKEEKKI